LPFGERELLSVNPIGSFWVQSAREANFFLGESCWGFLCLCFSDQAFFHPERHGNGVTPPESTSIVGVWSRDSGATSPHHHQPTISGHGYVSQCCLIFVPLW